MKSDDEKISCSNDGDGENFSCCICLSSDMSALEGHGRSLISVPCPGKHRFHLECLRSWLQVKDSCPCDRTMLSQAFLTLMREKSRQKIVDVDWFEFAPIAASVPIAIGDADALIDAATFRVHCIQKAMGDLSGPSLIHKWARALLRSSTVTITFDSITGIPKKDFKLLKLVIADLCALSISFLRDPYFIECPSEPNRYQLMLAILRAAPDLRRLRCTAERLLRELRAQGFLIRAPRAERDRVRRANDGLVWYATSRILRLIDWSNLNNQSSHRLID